MNTNRSERKTEGSEDRGSAGMYRLSRFATLLGAMCALDPVLQKPPVLLLVWVAVTALGVFGMKHNARAYARSLWESYR